METEIKAFEETVAGRAPRYIPHVFLGHRQFIQHNYEAALDYYEKAGVDKSDNTKDFAYMFEMAIAYRVTGDFRKARGIAQRMIEIDPEDSGGHFLDILPDKTCKTVLGQSQIDRCGGSGDRYILPRSHKVDYISGDQKSI